MLWRVCLCERVRVCMYVCSTSFCPPVFESGTERFSSVDIRSLLKLAGEQELGQIWHTSPGYANPDTNHCFSEQRDGKKKNLSESPYCRRMSLRRADSSWRAGCYGRSSLFSASANQEKCVAVIVSEGFGTSRPRGNLILFFLPHSLSPLDGQEISQWRSFKAELFKS